MPLKESKGKTTPPKTKKSLPKRGERTAKNKAKK
jgi:hypothetical protein